ncbi:glutaredoxin family protein [Micrococcus sp.]|uniref:glutaredoxin family protein n=1 Tax=Micrococcus sp. TaxID=1271 RepID=UPI002A915CB0|nr:glutaredoxin family protein [Micrococcus sp.]MDY6055227.1 glutaredoxin family protein [Micrococcus sp.]
MLPAPPPSSARVQLLVSPGCHLCVEAEAAVAEVCRPRGVAWEVVDGGAHPALLQTFAEEVPVLFVDGVQRDFWRVDRARLARLLDTTV